MNFFTVGFLLANIQLNPAWGAGYLLKLAGGLFMIGGIAEISDLAPEVRQIRSVAVLFAGACAAAAFGAFFTAGSGGTAASVAGAVDQAATVALALLFFFRLFGIFRARRELFEHEPLVRKTERQYMFFAGVSGIVIAADAVNRITAGTIAADAAGVVMAVGRIVGYVLLISCGLGFNKLRMQFDRQLERRAGQTK